MRDQRFRLYEKLDYQPWIENITNNKENVVDDFTSVRHKLDKKLSPGDILSNIRETELRCAYPTETRNNMYDEQRKPR